MSGSEILIIVFGLFLGYWVVSNLMSRAENQREVVTTTDRADALDDHDRNAGQLAPWHDVLGTAPDASTEEIRKAYRILIGQHHPDKVAALGRDLQLLAERKSKEFNRAYCQAMEERGSPP